MKYLILLFTFLITASVANAQYETVVLNYEKSYFGENELLPANKFFMLQGISESKISYVEVSLYQENDIEDILSEEPLYTTFWKRDVNNSSPDFNIPVNYKLDEGESYDFYIQYYRNMTDKETREFMMKLQENLSSYIDLAIEADKNEIKFAKKERQMIADMNNIVERGMKYYRHKTMTKWPGFSDVIKLQLDQLDGRNVDRAPENVVRKDTSISLQGNYRNVLISGLKDQVYSEVATHMNSEMFILYDDKLIQDYPVEKVDGRYYLAPHVGYGGTFLNGKADDFNYASGFYAGLSFPLASQSKSNFLSRTSVNVGAFLGKLEDTEGNEIGGPLFKIPTYVSLGYRPFAFFRVQAGAAFLENTNGNAVISGFNNQVKIAPFIGISAEFNMFFNLEK